MPNMAKYAYLGCFEVALRGGIERLAPKMKNCQWRNNFGITRSRALFFLSVGHLKLFVEDVNRLQKYWSTSTKIKGERWFFFHGQIFDSYDISRLMLEQVKLKFKNIPIYTRFHAPIPKKMQTNCSAKFMFEPIAVVWSNSNVFSASWYCKDRRCCRNFCTESCPLWTGKGSQVSLNIVVVGLVCWHQINYWS